MRLIGLLRILQARLMYRKCSKRYFTAYQVLGYNVDIDELQLLLKEGEGLAIEFKESFSSKLD